MNRVAPVIGVVALVVFAPVIVAVVLGAGAASTQAAQPQPAPAAPRGPFAAAVIAAATTQIGVPYAWAGGSITGPTRGVCTAGAAANDCNIVGFDCSGLVLWAAYQASDGRLRLSHYAATQVDGDAARYGATVIPRGQEQPGDFIAFTDPGSGPGEDGWRHHIGIYIGNNQMINAPASGALVRVDSLTSSYYASGQEWTVVRYG